MSERTEQLESLARAAEIAGIEVAEPALPQGRHVVLRGMRFHYLDWGHDSARPILFLHGGGLNAHTFDLVALALRTDFRCLALDLRGHGDSEWDPVMDYRIETHAADVSAFVDHLGLRDLVLVGMSLGGLNAIWYARERPQALAALVLIDIGPKVQAEGARRIRNFMAVPAEFDSMDEYIAMAKAFNPRRDEASLRGSLGYNLRRTPAGRWAWKYDRRAREQGASDDDRAERLWAAVAAIDCPVLVIRGAESDVFSAEDAARLVSQLPRGSVTTIQGAGHSVQGDNPAALAMELRRFLARAAGAGTVAAD